ncbi:MAG: xanthine dehydrogenase family protein subunit M [Gammaproteobacteria bacterium]|nr:xanthine dehydrogenase family protein subunit M [Gammaproteobacteria bacterium]
MYPRPIDHYFAPTDLDEALALLSEYGGGARVLSGGQSLISQLKAREDTAKCIVDINRVPGLATVEFADGILRIGTMVRHAELIRNSVINEYCPILNEAARYIGDPQVRNRGTIGGSLAFADTASDLPVAVTALNAHVATVKMGGQGRSLCIEGFFLGPGKTALADDEMIREIVISGLGRGCGGAYIKHSHVVNGIAIISTAVQLSLDESKKCTAASIVVGGLTSMPARAEKAEAHLLGSVLDAGAVAQAAETAATEIEVMTDFRASAEYRRNLVGHYVTEMIRASVSRAGGVL